MTVERRMLMAAAGNTKPSWSPVNSLGGVARMRFICSNPANNNFVAVGSYGTAPSNRPAFTYSSDGGYTFSATANMNASTSVGAGPIACDSTGRYVMVCNTNDSVGVSTGMSYFTSTNGTTWTGPTTISTDPLYVPNDITVNAAGRWVCVLNDSNGGAGNQVGRWTTSTNGTTWSAPALFNGSTVNFWPLSVQYNSTLARWIAVGYNQITQGQGMYSTSTNGTTWTTPANLTASTNNSVRRVASSALAGIYATAALNAAGVSATHTVWCRSTNGTTWSSPALFNGSTGGDIFLTTVADSSPTTGTFLFAGGDGTTGVTQAYYTISTDGGNTWISPTQYVVGSNFEPTDGAFNGVGRMVQVGSGPVSTTSYWTAINGI